MSTTGSGRGTEVEIERVNKTALVKNRAPAPIQISAEQLLREVSGLVTHAPSAAAFATAAFLGALG